MLVNALTLGILFAGLWSILLINVVYYRVIKSVTPSC